MKDWEKHFQEGEKPFYAKDAADGLGKVKGLRHVLFERGTLFRR